MFQSNTIYIWCNCLGLQVGAYFLNQRKVNTKIIVLFFGLIAISGMYASSYTTSMARFNFFYSAMSGFGQGSLYMLPLVSCWEWYPDNKGLIAGIITCSYGLSSLIFAPIIMSIINPENLSPSIWVSQDLTLFDNHVSTKFPNALRYVIRIWTL